MSKHMTCLTIFTPTCATKSTHDFGRDTARHLKTLLSIEGITNNLKENKLATTREKTIYTVESTLKEALRAFPNLSPQWQGRVIDSIETDIPLIFDTIEREQAVALQSVLNSPQTYKTEVQSDSSEELTYTVTSIPRGPISCTCGSFLYSTTFCKHMVRVQGYYSRYKNYPYRLSAIQG